jgi:hypothetical protein
MPSEFIIPKAFFFLLISWMVMDYLLHPGKYINWMNKV